MNVNLTLPEPMQGHVELNYLECVNYAMHHNHCPAMLGCVVVNEGELPMEQLTLRIGGEMVKQSEVLVDLVSPHTRVEVSTLLLEVDAAQLVALTEGVQTTFLLSVERAGEKVVEQSCDLNVMAFDQWSGIRIRPELLSAFVTPNNPVLSRVAVAAARKMEQWTGRSDLDAYFTKDPHRARQQVAAVFEALRAESLVYVMPPASFEVSGQRLRLADRVLQEKLGCCIDLSLLIASCLENIGLHPLLVLTQGHCMVGAWLVDDCYDRPIGDDGSFLLNGASDGIGELVVLEATTLTISDPVTFDDAVALAEQRLQREEEFDCFVDVFRCRLDGVRPLPHRVERDGHWEIEEGIAHDEGTTTVRRRDRYDLTTNDSEGAGVTKMTLWERKLLDFSLRNSLLNMRQGKKIIPLLSFAVDRLEDTFQEGKSFRLMPFPLNGKAQPGPYGLYDSSLYSQTEAVALKEMEGGKVFTFHGDGDLKEAVKFVYRASRTSMEENGANNLYLVLGVLRWFETENSQQPRHAPLLLLPVELVRGGQSGYTLRRRDEEIVLNITLAEMLRQQHDVDLSALNTLPRDEHGADVKKIFAIVRQAIRLKKGWNVVEEALLGLFSFNKFVMWHDLHSNADRILESPIVQSLVEGSLQFNPEAGADAHHADREQKPEDYMLPVDVDSSQLEAVIDSGEGKSFVLHGPPGTGKSQTITNMIANALWQGKRVLFVAEKMAALEVVQSRLEKIGLAPFCLELHSNKVTKSHFLRQMDAALGVAHRQKVSDFSRESETLYARRQEILRYIDALHARHASGFSLYDHINRYLTIEADPLEMDTTPFATVDRYTLQQMMESIERLDKVVQVVGLPSQHPLRGLLLTDGSAEAESRLPQLIDAALDALEGWQQARQALGQQWPQTATALRNAGMVSQLYSTVQVMQQRHEAQRRLEEGYYPSLASVDRGALRHEWEDIQTKGSLSRFFAQRAFLKRMRIYKPSFSVADMEALLADWAILAQHDPATLPMVELIPPDGFQEAFSFSLSRLNQQGIRLQKALDAFSSLAQVDWGTDWNDSLPPMLQRWAGGVKQFRQWYLWCKERLPLAQQGLDPVVLQIEHGATPRDAAQAFAKAFHHQQAVSIINANEALRFFNGKLFDDTIAEYRKLTAEFQQLCKQELFCRLAANIPNADMEPADSSEIGILKRNIKNGGRGTSIRAIIDQIPHLLPRLCPVMLMSPLSVAQYLALGNEKFDLVLFDEASQMPTPDAVGAIARGRSLVVVGDPKQMPPTSFFATSQVGEDEASIDDMESILDDCIALSFPSKYLTWHYRSKHESLIAFSNSQYYDGRLLTFPSVDDRITRVTLRRVEGSYDKGHTRSNRAEAQAIVDEVMRRLASADERSIGIVSFSKVQQDLIEDLLCDALAQQPQLEQKAFSGSEPVFVKNLENVQGDERDVILFSVGYGPDKQGKVSMNFGPLNVAGGERRLNVAVSRARYEMVVFSTLRSDQIDLQRTRAVGVEGLKRFLAFAEQGIGALPQAVQPAPEGDAIPLQIADALRREGYRCETQVGHSQFKIDVAVQHPRREQEYLLGIVCDGPGYYATKTVRDREVVQPSVLRMLHWQITHVWTLDWLEHRDEVVQRLIRTLRSLEDATPEDPDPDEPTALSQPEEALKESPVEEYRFAQLPTPQPASDVENLLNQHSEELNQQVRQLVEVEQPIVSGLLYSRIAKLWSINRVTLRLQQAIDQMVKQLGVCTTPNGENGYVCWIDSERAASWKHYRTQSGRDIQDVPLVEVQNAMLHIIGQQVAMPEEDLKGLAARQLGYARMGNNIRQVTSEALAALLADGRLILADGKVTQLSATSR